MNFKKLTSKIAPVLDIFNRLFLLVALVAVGYGIYHWFIAPSSVSLSPIKTPPVFSVNYVYYFSPVAPGMVNSFSSEINKDIDDIKNAGFDGVKIGFHFRQNNVISYEITNKVAAKKLYPIGILMGHSEKPKERAFNESELKEWEKFTRETVRKFKNSVYFWEVWNEPNMTALKFRYGTPAEYLTLLKRTYTIIKEENPQAQVVVTADYSDTESEVFTNEFLSLGSTEYFDYLSFHPYNAFDPNSRYNLTETIAQEKELSKKYNKPLWITEIGTPDSASSEDQQAETALAVFQAACADKIPVVWFHYSDKRLNIIDNQTGWGLVRTDGSFKPSYEKLKAFMASVKK